MLLGVDWTIPENSAPDTQGKAFFYVLLVGGEFEDEERVGMNIRGWFWYFPWICRMSKKFVAAAWTSMRYSFAEGLGSGRFVTFSSFGPCFCVILRYV